MAEPHRPEPEPVPVPVPVPVPGSGQAPSPTPAGLPPPSARVPIPVPPPPDTIRQKYRRAFLRGLGTLLPTLLTVYILLFTYGFLDNNIASPLNSAIKTQLKSTSWGSSLAVSILEVEEDLTRVRTDPAEDAERQRRLELAIEERYPGWLGIAVAVVGIFLVGFFLTGFIGRRIWAGLERWFVKLPVVRSIYPSAKQITEFFIKHDEDRSHQFSSVVFVPFPGQGQWSIGFVTSEGVKDVDRTLGKRFLNVFIPWTPTPVTGMVILVPEDQVHPVDMTVDEAIKYYLTGGVVLPPRQLVGRALEKYERERAAKQVAGGEARPASAPPAR